MRLEGKEGAAWLQGGGVRIGIWIICVCPCTLDAVDPTKNHGVSIGKCPNDIRAELIGWGGENPGISNISDWIEIRDQGPFRMRVDGFIIKDPEIADLVLSEDSA